LNTNDDAPRLRLPSSRHTTSAAWLLTSLLAMAPLAWADDTATAAGGNAAALPEISVSAGRDKAGTSYNATSTSGATRTDTPLMELRSRYA
jgi:iron complex outermembrane receptor protein